MKNTIMANKSFLLAPLHTFYFIWLEQKQNGFNNRSVIHTDWLLYLLVLVMTSFKIVM